MSDRKLSFKELVEAISSLDIQDAIIKNIVDLSPEKLTAVSDLVEKLSGKNGGQLVDIYRGNVLRLVSGGEDFNIDAVDGSESLIMYPYTGQLH